MVDGNWVFIQNNLHYSIMFVAWIEENLNEISYFFHILQEIIIYFVAADLSSPNVLILCQKNPKRTLAMPVVAKITVYSTIKILIKMY